MLQLFMFWKDILVYLFIYHITLRLGDVIRKVDGGDWSEENPAGNREGNFFSPRALDIRKKLLPLSLFAEFKTAAALYRRTTRSGN